MLTTTRKPASVGAIIREEFLAPLGLSEFALADAMGVSANEAQELCDDQRSVTASTALVFARVFGNSADFRLNIRRRAGSWAAMHSTEDIDRVSRAKRLIDAA